MQVIFPRPSRGSGLCPSSSILEVKQDAVNSQHAQRNDGLLDALLRVVRYFHDQVVTRAKLAAFLPLAFLNATF